MRCRILKRVQMWRWAFMFYSVSNLTFCEYPRACGLWLSATGDQIWNYCPCWKMALVAWKREESARLWICGAMTRLKTFSDVCRRERTRPTNPQFLNRRIYLVIYLIEWQKMGSFLPHLALETIKESSRIHDLIAHRTPLPMIAEEIRLLP